MNKYVNKYNKKNENKMRNLNSQRPKDYWSILNRLKNRSKVEMPGVESLYEHFKTVNNNPDHNTDVTDILVQVNLDEYFKQSLHRR